MREVNTAKIVPKHAMNVSFQELETQLSQEDLRLFVMIDGSTNLNDLARLVGIAAETAQKAITSLLHAGAIELYERLPSMSDPSGCELLPYEWPFASNTHEQGATPAEEKKTYTHIYPKSSPKPSTTPTGTRTWPPAFSLEADEHLLQLEPSQDQLPQVRTPSQDNLQEIRQSTPIPPEAYKSPLPLQRGNLESESSDSLPSTHSRRRLLTTPHKSQQKYIHKNLPRKTPPPETPSDGVCFQPIGEVTTQLDTSSSDALLVTNINTLIEDFPGIPSAQAPERQSTLPSTRSIKQTGSKHPRYDPHSLLEKPTIPPTFNSSDDWETSKRERAESFASSFQWPSPRKKGSKDS